jgi:hypothetical protein
MSFFAGDLKATISADNKGFTTAINQSQKQVNTFGDFVEKNSQKIKAMGIAMTVAGGLIVAGLTKTIQAASNAAEVSTKFAFTFRDIQKESSVALKDLVDNYGMSVVSGQKLLASTGDIYKGFGANSKRALELSVAIQKLAADHTSFNNVQGGVARASEIITKATLGEREGLIQLGIKVSEQMVMERLALQGKEKLAGAALFLAKSEATLALITEQSGGAINDYGRTAGSTANQSRLFSERLTDLKVVIGTQLLPVITPLISSVTGFITKMAEWTKEHPELTKAIVLTTAALGGFMLIGGPIVALLPKLVAGYTALKGVMTATIPILVANKNHIQGLTPSVVTENVNKFGNAIKSAGSALAKMAAAGAAFYVGWQVGKAIDDFLGLSSAIQKGVDALSISVEKWEKLSMIQMGWTEQGKQVLFLKNTLIDLAKQIDPTVTGLRGATQVIKNNKEVYEKLHPRLQRIVDGMTKLRPAIQGVIDKGAEIPAQTEEQRKVLESILESSGMRIKELTLSETEFKIAQLNREYQKNIEILNQNAATKSQMQVLERSHNLEISRIKEESYLAQKEKEAKRKEEEIKAKEEEFRKEQERWQTHSDFLEGLKKEQQDLILKNIEERDGWRAAELMRVDQWEIDQKTLLFNRLQDQKINFDQYQEEITALKQTGEDKREAIENEARDRQEKAEKEKEDRLWSNFESMVAKKQAELGKYFNFISNLNTVYTALRESQLNSWYDEELRRINESGLSNEERTIAIENLDARMHAKKAALEAQAQRRERAMAIAQAIANTAVAITTALKSLPWPFNLPAIAFAIATGAAQIAAIGGAFKAPGIESFGPGGETGGGTVGGGGGTEAGREIGGGGRGGERPGFQSGTNGFITPPSDFLVGEPYSPERIQLRGDVQGVKMAVTPMGQTAAASQGGVNIHLDFSGMHVIDATDFENRVRDFLPKLMQKFFDSGTNRFPRRYLK